MLTAALQDVDPEIRKQAARSLCRIPSVQQLIDELEHKDSNKRIQAVVGLQRMGPQAKDAVPALIKLMQSKDKELVVPRYFAAYTLAEIGPDAKEGVPALIEAMKSDELSLRNNARHALKKIDPEAARKAGIP